jgi:Uma2 family endonuclease
MAMAHPASAPHALLDHDGPWTEEDFLALPVDRRIELVDGGLLVSPNAGRRHQRLAFRLATALDAAVPDGLEVMEAINVRAGPGRILIPDITVVTDPGADDVVADAANIAMVVEIVSPGSVAADRAVKPPLYAAARIPHYLRVEFDGVGAAATAYVLRDGHYVEAISALAGQTLTLVEPFPVVLDPSALARRTRRRD